MRFDKQEGKMFPKDVYFLYGRNIENKIGPNGFYILIRLKWINRVMEYKCSSSYSLRKGPCYPGLLVVFRKVRNIPPYK